MCKESREDMLREIESLLIKSKENLKQVELIVGDLEKAMFIDYSLKLQKDTIIN